ncbi:NADH-ubiquinone oxidoreductase chain 1 [Mortierella sp. AD094]|nr:NADH-ubiquinone oxidoreductase chain 1 [Mortierella sp. AD094]
MYSIKPASRLQQPKPTVATTATSASSSPLTTGIPSSTAGIGSTGIPSSIPGAGSIGSIANGIRRGIPSAISTPKPVLPPPLERQDQPNSSNGNLAPPSVVNASSSPLDISRPASPNAPPASKTENVTVSVRIRPFSSSELKVAGGPTDVWDISDDESRIGYADDYAVNTRRAPVEYAFGTVFAYGQTSSGKTYSGSETQPGITPRAVEDIFKYIRENSDREFLLRVSYLEIYNESIRDLLSPEAIDLRIHEDRRRGVYVSPLKEEIVTTPSQVMRIIERGDYQRHVSSTDFNAHSSRSHSIFQIVIESRDRSPGNGGSPTSRKPLGAKSATAVRVSQLNLIDLAGSEKAASNEERRKEGAFINKSLLTLGTVISKLTEERGAHIPYRDSKLTRILQSSLNGNARVSVICTISPSHLNVEESHNTLKFASRVKKVVTKAQTNQVMDDKALLEKYRREISELKAQLMLTASGESGVGSAVTSGKQAELSTLLEKERMKHEEEMVEMNMVRNALKERIDHLTKLILTSQSINTKAAAPEVPAGRYTVETSADGTVLEFPKELESRLAHKDAIMKQMELDLEAQQEKMALMKVALEKTAKGETVDIEKTLAKVEQDLPREKLLSEKRASIANIYSLEQADGANSGDLAALRALQRKRGEGASPQSDSRDDAMSFMGADDEDDEDLMDTALNREELKSLRQAKRELEIIVIEQEKKLEDMVAFEDSDEFRDLVLELQEHREKIMAMEEEREGYRVTITDLRNTIRKLELKQSTSAQSDSVTPPTSSVGGMTGSSAGSTPHNLAIAAAKIKELEIFAQKERRLRMDEQSRNMGRIAALEAELTMMKAELSVRNLAAYS